MTTLGSSSKGNSYVIECKEDTLIIELGINFKDILSTIKYDIGKVRGCLVSHLHKDHSKYIKDAIYYGLPVYSCKETSEANEGVITMPLGKKMMIGNFSVQPIPVVHSCECYAFLIEHPEMGRTLFVTDCVSFGYKVKDIDHLMIEANYDDDSIIENAMNDSFSRSQSQNHMSFDNTLKAIRNNYNPRMKDIVLLHASMYNSNTVKYEKDIKEEFGLCNVYVAEKGLKICFEKDEF